MKIKTLCPNCQREFEHEEEGLTFDEAIKKYIPDKDELCDECKQDLREQLDDTDNYDMQAEAERDYQKDCGWPEKFKN